MTETYILAIISLIILITFSILIKNENVNLAGEIIYNFTRSK